MRGFLKLSTGAALLALLFTFLGCEEAVPPPLAQPTEPTRPTEPPRPKCEPVPAPADTAGVDLSGTLRDVETGLPARGVVRAYDASWNLLAESLPCADDGRFALTISDASVAEITLQAALGTGDEHAFVRTVRLPARDDFNLEVKAVSFADLKGISNRDGIDITPEQWVMLMDEYNFRFWRDATSLSETSGGSAPFDLAGYRGLIILQKALDPGDESVFARAEQNYIARIFRELVEYIPGMSGKGEVIIAGEDYVLPAGDTCPVGHRNCGSGWFKDGWILVKPVERYGAAGSAWQADLDGDNTMDAGRVDYNKSRNGVYDESGSREGLIAHELLHVIGPFGHPYSIRETVMLGGFGTRMFPADLKVLGIIYGYPAGTYLQEIMRVHFGPLDLTFSGQTIEDHTFTVGIAYNMGITLPHATSDSPPITYTLGPVVPPNMGYYGGNWLGVTETLQVAGTWNMVFTATDAAGRTASLHFTIIVRPA